MKDLSKDELRRELRVRRGAISDEERVRANTAITAAVLSDPYVVTAKCVHAYLSTEAEVATDEIIRVLLDRGITVMVPWMLPDGSMGSTRLTQDDLASIAPRGPRGVPAAPVFRPADVSAIDVVIVPLLGFDSRHHRVGMGAGHYDRFLADPRFATSTTIGLAYECQRVATVPTESHDIALNRVISA